MKTKMMMLGLMVMIAAAAVSVHAAENGTVKVTAAGPAKVWIDDKPVSGAVSLPEGNHTVKVVKEGASSGLVRTVVVKPKATLDVVVDFTNNAINVKNAAALGYTPTEGETKKLITPPSGSEPPAEKPGAAAGAEPEKGKAGPDDKSTPRACAPGEWCPEPAENEIGPPAPPGKDKHPAAGPAEKPGPAGPETKPGATAEKKPEPAETEPGKKPAEVKKEPLAGSTVKKPAVAPCKLKGGADTCAYYGGRDDVRETLFTYYCDLANHDLDAAYKYWSADPTRDLGWFYENSGNFCKVDDYRIQNLDIVKPSENQAKATYTLELLDGRGQVTEIRKMSAVLTRKSDVWSIKTNSREGSAPAAKPGETKTAAKPPAPKKPITKKPAPVVCPVPTPEAAKPNGTTSTETKTTETKTTETKTTETKPTAPKTPATKPPTTKTPATKSTAPKTPATKPKETKTTETNTTVTKPPESKPAPKPVESAPMPSAPPASTPAPAKP